MTRFDRLHLKFSLTHSKFKKTIMSIKTVNPFNNELIKSFDEMTAIEIETAIAGADLCFQTWKNTSYEIRAKVLHNVASLLRLKKIELAKTLTLEMGKLINESEGEIDLAADIFDYYADNGENFLADKVLKVDTGEAIVRSSPIGTLLGVQPWNFPFYQVARFAAPNVMVGNTILLKHASNVLQCGILIEKIFTEAGAPIGLYTNLLITGEKISALIDDERIKGASLTGSENAGAKLAEQAGKNLKKSVLELGGNDVFIVLEDADMDKTVDWAVVGRINNNGQCCIASKRFIVLDAVADEFLEKFKSKLSALKVGNPMDETTQLGPMSSEEAAENLQKQIDKTVAEGAKILLGGKRVKGKGAFIEATILTDIKPGMTAYKEELFGPVASFYRVKDEDEAIKLANDSQYGLGGSIFSKDIERAKKLADRIDTGMVFINHPTWTKTYLPFGGTKRSGYGRELSSVGIEEFVNKKLIRVSGISDPF